MITSKVTYFLYASPIHPLVNGILLRTPYYDHDRFTSMLTESREEATKARGLKFDIIEAWKRRREKELLRSCDWFNGLNGHPTNRSSLNQALDEP
jgi:hypothetical protein